MYKRLIQQNIEARRFQGKVIILTGPRQVGKTTLIRHILNDRHHLFLDGDDPTVRNALATANTDTVQRLLQGYQEVFIDEAQRIDNIGLTLKIMTDQFPDVQVYVSGSSAFELQQVTSESLTGRKFEFNLFPVSWTEFEAKTGYIRAQQQLEHRLIYGMYPDIINHPGDEDARLLSLADSYLHKDLLALGNLRKPQLVSQLLEALAHQVGQEVSYNELSRMLGVDKETIANYISILERGYVVFTLRGFKRNLRNEIKANRKVYFWDNGIRNAILGNFNTLGNRQDVGALWENFLLSERLKVNAYQQSQAKSFFWRTTAQKEIDYIEAEHDVIRAYEFKWSPSAKWKQPKSFVNAYPETSIELIHSENFRPFVEGA